jgi:alkanesulfonate monooxygenase SsuD/methylene tetrahydromethanopterin reductase-like flavin-dependent oxidoreductase (luciferase family)
VYRSQGKEGTVFRTYYFTEMPYPYIPAEEFVHTIRATFPNRWFDPDAGHEVYHKYFDLVQAADELGLDVMFNEHHGTMANMNAAMPLSLAIAARETKQARILALGNPVANRPDPVRVATEMAMIDVVSGGRLDCGFIRGIMYEMPPTNASPIDTKARLYEAIDLIVKAWTSHDGPFSWEGEFFHHREVDILPRPYQQPYPPIWVTTSNSGSAPEIARREYTIATIFNGKKVCSEIFGAYRAEASRLGRPEPHPEKLAYCCFVYVGESDREALQTAPKLQDYLRQSRRTAPGQSDIPGYVDAPARAVMLRKYLEEGTPFLQSKGLGDPLALAESGVALWGSPESVFGQLRDFFYAVGGFGNLLGMFEASTMTYAATRRSMERFSREVLPRFRQEVYEPWLKDHGFVSSIGVTTDPSSGFDFSAEAGFTATPSTGGTVDGSSTSRPISTSRRP